MTIYILSQVASTNGLQDIIITQSIYCNRNCKQRYKAEQTKFKYPESTFAFFLFYEKGAPVIMVKMNICLHLLGHYTKVL